MKVNDPNLSPPGSAATAGAAQTQRSTQTGGNTNGPSSAASAASSDNVNISDLGRSLRSLAADSPERQNKIEQLAQSYGSGTYSVDHQATAGAIIDDATKR
jgi:flagellar biosynthesis anti-sigma factor FlgM